MAFWENVNKELKKAVGEVSTVAKTGKQRLKVHTLHKQAERIFTDLGGLVYDMAKPPYENPLEDSVVMRLVEEIRKLEAEASSIEDTITGRVTKEVPSSIAAPPVTAKAPIKAPQRKSTEALKASSETVAVSKPQKAQKDTETAPPKTAVKETVPPKKNPSAGVKAKPGTLTSDALTERVAELLNDGVRQKDIVTMLGIVKGTVSKHKKKALARGLLK